MRVGDQAELANATTRQVGTELTGTVLLSSSLTTLLTLDTNLEAFGELICEPLNLVMKYCTEFIVVTEEERENSEHSEERFCLFNREGQSEGQHATTVLNSCGII
jgi:hypothetical protein